MNSKIYLLTSELSQIKTAVTQTFSLATPSAEKVTKNQSQLKEAQENKKLMTFNRNSIEGELVKWQCTQNLDSEAESNGQENEKLKKLLNPIVERSNFDYEKHLKEISSLTSVFNLSQSYDKNKESSKSENRPQSQEDFEFHFSDPRLNEFSLETPVTIENALQSEYRLQSYLSGIIGL
jgi:hypothetical protein